MTTMGDAGRTPLERAAQRTYRYLRLTIVGLVLLLAVSVIVEAAQCGGFLDSISSTFYTPARSVFVGALIGIGAALIAVRGRPGPENALLNIAGMAAAVVALVPTPLPARVGACAGAPSPAEVAVGVGNNVWALLAAGVFGLAAGAVNEFRSTRPGWWTLAMAGALWVAGLLWFLLGRESFVDGAHYAASALLFVLLTVIAVINAVRVHLEPPPPLLSVASYRAVYWLVAAVMAATLLTAGVLFFTHALPVGVPGGWMLWAEAVLIGAFALYWLAQTAQFWDTGVPGSG